MYSCLLTVENHQKHCILTKAHLTTIGVCVQFTAN